jgi:hypothetical protein
MTKIADICLQVITNAEESLKFLLGPKRQHSKMAGKLDLRMRGALASFQLYAHIVKSNNLSLFDKLYTFFINFFRVQLNSNCPPSSDMKTIYM